MGPPLRVNVVQADADGVARGPVPTSTGLGLPLSRALAKAGGGWLGLEFVTREHDTTAQLCESRRQSDISERELSMAEAAVGVGTGAGSVFGPGSAAGRTVGAANHADDAVANVFHIARVRWACDCRH